MKKSFPFLSMAAIIILSLAIPGAWAQYTFTVIAETSNPGFSDFEQGYALGPTIDSQGRIVFVAYIIGRNPFFNAIYSRNGGALTTIADSIGTNLQTLTSPVISGWTVAFQAYIGGGGKESGIFTGNGGGLTTVVRTSDVTWAGFGTPPMNADGVMAFTAAEQILFDFNGHPIGGGTSGVYTSAAGTLAFTEVVNGVSRGIDRAVISSDGTVAYLQQVDTNLNGAIHLRGSANTIIASIPDPIYKRLGGPTISASGAPAFLATLNTNSHAIFSWKNGVTTKIIESRQFSVNDDFYIYDVYGDPAINSSGTVVFKANTGNGIPLFTGKGGAITRVIGPGDTINGYGVGGVNIGVNAINDSGQITFWYSRFGADGAVKGIAGATPTPAAPNAALTKLPNGDLQIIFSEVLQGSSDLSGWADVTPTPTSPYVIPVAQLVGK